MFQLQLLDLDGDYNEYYKTYFFGIKKDLMMRIIKIVNLILNYNIASERKIVNLNCQYQCVVNLNENGLTMTSAFENKSMDAYIKMFERLE